MTQLKNEVSVNVCDQETENAGVNGFNNTRISDIFGLKDEL